MNVIVEPIYTDRKMQSGIKDSLDKLTSSKHWDYPQFAKVITTLAAHRQYIPAHNRPDSIHIQGLRPKLDHLQDLSDQLGLETA